MRWITTGTIAIAALAAAAWTATAQEFPRGRYETRGITMTLGRDGRATFTSARDAGLRQLPCRWRDHRVSR